jgi:hypothetical protein
MTRAALVSSLLLAGCGSAITMISPRPTMPPVRVDEGITIYLDLPANQFHLRAAAFRSRVLELLDASGAHAVLERDGAGATLGPRDLVVRMDYTSSSQPNGTRVQSFLLLDTRIFSAAGAELRRDHPPAGSDREERVVRIDTSDRSPLVHSNYSIQIEVAGTDFASADHQFGFLRESGARVAEYFVAQLLVDLDRAVRLAAITPAR